MKDQLWEQKMTEKAHEEDWSRTISLAIGACQNIEARTKDSQRYGNSEWTSGELWDLHTCAKNKSAEPWSYEAHQQVSRASSSRFLKILSTTRHEEKLIYTNDDQWLHQAQVNFYHQESKLQDSHWDTWISD